MCFWLVTLRVYMVVSESVLWLSVKIMVHSEEMLYILNKTWKLWYEVSVWIQGEKIPGNGEFGLRVCMGYVMIMINYNCSWIFPDGMTHSQIDLAFTAVNTAILFVRPFRAVGCGTDLACWGLKIFPFLIFFYISLSSEGFLKFRERLTSHHP